jgi:hypothetical protein
MVFVIGYGLYFTLSSKNITIKLSHLIRKLSRYATKMVICYKDIVKGMPVIP